MIRLFPKVSTHFEPCSLFSSYSCTLYDIIIIVYDPLRLPPLRPSPPQNPGDATPPRIDAFPQILACPIIDDKSTPMTMTGLCLFQDCLCNHYLIGLVISQCKIY